MNVLENWFQAIPGSIQCGCMSGCRRLSWPYSGLSVGVQVFGWVGGVGGFRYRKNWKL